MKKKFNFPKALVSISIVSYLLLSSQAAAQIGHNGSAWRSEDGTWTGDKALRFLQDVERFSQDLAAAAGDNATCQNEYRICQDMHRALTQVYDNTYYVFHANVDFENNCLRNDLGIIMRYAEDIDYWNEWLRNRYYNLGMKNMEFQIGQYANLPLCANPNNSNSGNTANNGGTDTSGGTGITTNTSKLALNGTRACQNADLKNGRHWKIQNPRNSLSRSEYYEHEGYLCKSDGMRFFAMGSPYLAFNCSSGWTNCSREITYDGYVRTTTKTVIINGRRYNKGTIDWANSSSLDHDIYQGWWN